MSSQSSESSNDSLLHESPSFSPLVSSSFLFFPLLLCALHACIFFRKVETMLSCMRGYVHTKKSLGRDSEMEGKSFQRKTAPYFRHM
mmetsp:Transcript_15058/g.30509  ORF Transcript_15058/g.30509 Transcript_15058/m.30509 type:complete len:87 (-) Transcript_15058:25-285(-)